MEYTIEEKNVSPTKVVQTIEPVPFSNLRREATKLYGQEKNNLDSALIALVHAPKLEPSTPVTIAYPSQRFIPLNDTLYKNHVIQRSKVVSTLHCGNYENLEEAFAPLLNYLAEKELTPIFPLRMIFHKSVKYKALFQRKEDEFVTEIQIPVEIVSTSD